MQPSEDEKQEEEIKQINNKSNQLRTIQTDSGFRDFTRQFRIKGVEGLELREFLQSARLEVFRLIKENRKTRFIMILNCKEVRKEF